jgi:exosortase/archaeosortase family protein
MFMVSLKKYPFIIYLLKFISLFSILYYCTIAVIGLAAPGGYYISFIENYLNYVSWLRFSLLHAAKEVLYILGFTTCIVNIYTLHFESGKGVHIGFDCLGYGVMSFWAAFIIANDGSISKKIKWAAVGLIVLWCINVLRISLLMIAINKKWQFSFGLDHHSWFNIGAYACIFIGIYLFDKSQKKSKTPDA